MVANVTLENECVPQGSSDVQPNAKRLVRPPIIYPS